MTDWAGVLAIDLGSSHGRAYWGALSDDGGLDQEPLLEVPNGSVRIGERWYWDLLRLFDFLPKAVRHAADRAEGRPFTVGICTWGVDYALLDDRDELLGQMHHYRDPRTTGAYDRLFDRASKEDIYAATGNMFLPINTLAQLAAEHRDRPWLLDKAAALLFPPDVMAWYLTGRAVNEITIASTSQFLDTGTRDWARPLLRQLGLPTRFLCPLVRPSSEIGRLRPSLREAESLPDTATVVAVCGHDTASALLATPFAAGERGVFISTGTWSLLGTELDDPDRSAAALADNFTNEIGADDRVVFHKILIGLWLIQECHRCWSAEGHDLSFAEIHAAAKGAPALTHLFQVDDPRFIAPVHMPSAIADWFTDRGLSPPDSVSAIARAVYESLAANHADTIERMERLTGRRPGPVHMVGGGVQAALLCQFTADATGRPVVAGPVEATVTGNMISQLRFQGRLADLEAGRALVRDTATLTRYEPSDTHAWARARTRLAEAAGD